ncbi:MAG TPA: sigma-70 family RNA polymerase sigma factor [Candidatus Limnocylindrales bacterium]|nr:sigma-70 family RNA polymerase sigma factor [Candidatus Limnocylindrales bacterium]
MDERELVLRAQHGDVASFEELVRRYQNVVFRTAYVICVGREEAEDAAQEAFVKAYRALPRFRPEAPFQPWLLRIVGNQARNRRRSAGRRGLLALRAEAQAGRPAETESPEAAVVATEARAALLEAVNRLRDDERLVVACRYFLDLSERDTAQALGCPPGTVKSRLSRALARLSAMLGEQAGAAPGTMPE